ncbi:helix-turn-helix domain-containing protein [Paenibacillus oryzisoli]|uniref:AraC family transcriptional regulator n=1 Tax=Paenibacillus oryzisoli TaxID=1850517 RepID=UPI003D26F702
MIKQMQKNQTLVRLLIFNILLVVIITVIPTLVFYQYFVSNYNKQLTKLNMQTVTQFRNFMDQKVLRDVIGIPNLYFTDLESSDPIVYPLQHDIHNDSSRILQTSKRIFEVKNRVSYLDSIDIYYRSNQILFQDTSVCFLPGTGCTLGFREAWLHEFSQSEKLVDWTRVESVEGAETKKLITYIRSIPYFAPSSSRLGIVAINLDVAVIQAMMKEYNFVGGSPLLAVREDGQLMIDTQEESTWEQIEPSVREKLLSAGQQDGIMYATVNGKSSILSYSLSEMNHWRYVSVVPVDAFFGKSIEIRNWLIVIASMLLFVNLLVAYWMTRRAYKPIGTEIDELKLNLERNKPIIRHNYILKLLTGRVQLNDRLLSNERVTGVQIDLPYYCCFVVQLLPQDNTPYEEVMMQVYNLVQALESDMINCRLFAVQDEDEHISGIINFDETASIDAILVRMTTIMDAQLNRSYTLSVGVTYAINDSDISDGYREAKEALPYAFLYPDTIMKYGELSILQRKETGPILTYLQQMEDQLRDGFAEQTLKTIQSLVDDLRYGEYTVAFCKSALTDVIAILRKRIHAHGQTSEEILGFDIQEAFKKLRSLTLFPDWLGPIVQIVTDKEQLGKFKVDTKLQDKINQFIEANLGNQLSLDLVAEHLNISSNYVSKLFKTVNGKTFTEYVTDLRLKRALVMLMEERLPVQDISSQLGYNSTHYFIRIFKEKYGHTPKQYQKLHEGRLDKE